MVVVSSRSRHEAGGADFTDNLLEDGDTMNGQARRNRMSRAADQSKWTNCQPRKSCGDVREEPNWLNTSDIEILL